MAVLLIIVLAFFLGVVEGNIKRYQKLKTESTSISAAYAKLIEMSASSKAIPDNIVPRKLVYNPEQDIKLIFGGIQELNQNIQVLQKGLADLPEHFNQAIANLPKPAKQPVRNATKGKGKPKTVEVVEDGADE